MPGCLLCGLVDDSNSCEISILLTHKKHHIFKQLALMSGRSTKEMVEALVDETVRAHLKQQEVGLKELKRGARARRKRELESRRRRLRAVR